MSPAMLAETPIAVSHVFKSLRHISRKLHTPSPISSVVILTCCHWLSSAPIRSMTLWPDASTPSICLSWLIAISMPEAVINPEITGWLKKLTKKPSRSTPMAINIRPESAANTNAAPMYSGLPGEAKLLSAEAVISAATATGPTAKLALVPKMAYRTSGSMLA